MGASTLILVVSILIQLAAAILALRLIKLSGRRTAWILIAGAIVLMAVRRGITLYAVLFSQPAAEPGLAAELVALGISILMLVGIAQVGPVFLLIQTSRRALAARVRQQAAVAQIGQLALQGTPLPRLMNEAVRLVAESLDVELCKVLELLPDGGHLILRAGVGWQEGLIDRAMVNAGVESQAGYTLGSGQPVMTHNLAEERRFSMPPLLREHGVAAGVSVVIRGEEKPYGILGAHTTAPRTFSDDDVHFVEAVANVLAAALERQRREKALKVTEERYRELFENALEIIYTHDLEGRFVSMNPAGERITGYSRDEILRMQMDDLLAPEYREAAKELIRSHLPATGPVIRQFDVISKAGDRISLEASLRLIVRDGAPVGLLGIGRDVSRRRELEKQLRQSQKLQAVGQLAGGVAHDFNNLLTVILGFSSQLLVREETSAEGRRNAAREISNAALRAASLTRQLLAFSRSQVLEPKVLDLNGVVAEMEKMLRRLIGEDIELRLVLEPDLGLVKADQGQLEQVIVNLAVNARDAMPNGGRLTLETRNEVAEAGSLDGTLPRRPQAWVVLSVSDSGRGIDDEIRDRIFEPFFTTKATGEGTGLGLSTVYGIVEQSGGNIAVESAAGGGAVFEVFLPRTWEPADEPAPETAPEEELRGSETVLVAEDDDMVRRLICSVLEDAGYRVVQAANGREAFAICSRSEQRIDLLISDVVMPEMGGSELARSLANRRRDMRLLFVSGHAGPPGGVEGLVRERAAFLQKPFDRQALLRKVRRTLDAEPPAA